jgi:hypothetical protein
MNKLNLYKTEISAEDGTPIRLVYDQEADILDIFFGKNEPATGVELTDQILLRLNQKTKRAISLMVLDFSILTQRTEYGPRSYPLNKLDELPEDMQELVLQLVTTLPVSQFLKLSHFQVSPTERVPLTYVELQPVMAGA